MANPPTPMTSLDHPRPTPEGTPLLRAAQAVDWHQVVLNGGPPCFHIAEHGRFCLRAQRWGGHDVMHPFTTLDAALERTLSSSQAALEAMREERDMWRQAAQVVGERLVDVGPQGYYSMPSIVWREWALHVLTLQSAALARKQEVIQRLVELHDLESPGNHARPWEPAAWAAARDEERGT